MLDVKALIKNELSFFDKFTIVKKTKFGLIDFHIWNALV